MPSGERQKAKTHCPKGHFYDSTNTYSRPGTNWRECRACKAAYAERARGGGAVAITSPLVVKGAQK